MARQPLYPQPWRKHMEAYQNFSGGLNTASTNDNLKNNEFTDLSNIDLGDRGSLRRRNGMVSHLASPVVGKGQGYFRYYKDDGTFDEILAVAGKLYKGGLELPITNLVSFQAIRPIEAIQFRDKLYLATGTKLVEYDGVEARVVVPYTPQPLEALYVGTNGLADNPDNYLQDGTATFLAIAGVTVSKRYGVINTATEFNTYVNKPSGMIVEYRYLYRKEGVETWTLGRDWSTDRAWNFTPNELGDYQIKVQAQDQAAPSPVGEEDKIAYIMPRYTVKATDENETIDTSTIHTCNRIVLHWDRLILYGDTTQKDAIYISHLKRGDYFPTLNSLLFENEKQEGVTSLVQYRDIIVAFTNSSIQALYGKSPQDYRRVMLNTSIGCIAPQSAKVMGNVISFLSKEGVHILKAIGYTEDRLNVEKIDKNIENNVLLHEDACGIVYDSQYHILFPQEKKRYRYYYEQKGVWTKDDSEKFDFARFYEYEGNLFSQSASTGEVFRFDDMVWTDAGFIYKDRIETKYFDFGQPYNPKKLKELQLLMAHHNAKVNVNVYVYADVALVLDPDESYASVDVNGNVIWTVQSNPNLVLDAGTTFGAWELGSSAFGNIGSQVHKLRVAGKCRRTKIVMEHQEATPNQWLGLGYIFKLKKA
jgi:hypothetical protein